MFSLATLIPFTIAAFVVVLVPGITVSAVIGTGLARGLVAGLWLELGAQIARLTMVVCVAVALAAITSVVTSAFDIIKYAGAAYLLWVGWGYLTKRHALSLDRAETAISPLRQVISGFLVLWGNPKALIFFGAFLPQFVNPRFPAWPQVLVLGLIEMGAALITDTGYLLIASYARGALTGGRIELVNRVAGILIIGAAVWLALQTQA
jgi:threonine/homoserine/homoserine lactone efflux protein